MPPSVAEGGGAGDRVVSDVVSAGGAERGAPSGERRAGAPAGPAGVAVGAGAGACAAVGVGVGVTGGRTALTGPDEVGAPSPGRRAVALRCTGAAGAVALPVSGRDRGTAGVGPVRVPGAVGEAGAVAVVAGVGSVGADGSVGVVGVVGAAGVAGAAEGGTGPSVRCSGARWTGGRDASPG
ncbi:hypothetical protein RKD32_003325 [Streptomyces sp. SAI-195]|uniref:hypothetical protein n=1 Tax=Streptomyces sp. SAI-195 TaxID=3377734 RepID=UPI003C7CBDE8